jgi:hypothetical protein
MDPLTVLLILLGSCVVCAVAGASVAREKGREPLEGVIFGALFGPIGIVVTALLPTKQTTATGQSNIGRDKVRSIDDRGQIAYLENRYRDILEEVAPDWRKTSYHRRKAILRNYDKKLMKEIKLTPTQFDELSVEALRRILNEH